MLNQKPEVNEEYVGIPTFLLTFSFFFFSLSCLFLCFSLFYRFVSIIFIYFILFYFISFYFFDVFIYFYCEHVCSLREELVAAYESLNTSIANLKALNLTGSQVEILLDKVCWERRIERREGRDGREGRVARVARKEEERKRGSL